MVEITDSSDKAAKRSMSLAVLLRITEWKRLVKLSDTSEPNAA
jgi:hypothetical protein